MLTRFPSVVPPFDRCFSDVHLVLEQERQSDSNQQAHRRRPLCDSGHSRNQRTLMMDSLQREINQKEPVAQEEVQDATGCSLATSGGSILYSTPSREIPTATHVMRPIRVAVTKTPTIPAPHQETRLLFGTLTRVVRETQEMCGSTPTSDDVRAYHADNTRQGPNCVVFWLKPRLRLKIGDGRRGVPSMTVHGSDHPACRFRLWVRDATRNFVASYGSAWKRAFQRISVATAF